ncbi:MAG TPA: hypothetical protein VNA68_03440 [Candidatus Dormibacteraeota bacterium]|nr:hypothetical protein [Candidatus Dormibacteraeota bacterium]
MKKVGHILGEGMVYEPCPTCQPNACNRLRDLGARDASSATIERLLDSPIPQRYIPKMLGGKQVVFDRKENKVVESAQDRISATGETAKYVAQELNQEAAQVVT